MQEPETALRGPRWRGAAAGAGRGTTHSPCARCPEAPPATLGLGDRAGAAAPRSYPGSPGLAPGNSASPTSRAQTKGKPLLAACVSRGRTRSFGKRKRLRTPKRLRARAAPAAARSFVPWPLNTGARAPPRSAPSLSPQRAGLSPQLVVRRGGLGLGRSAPCLLDTRRPPPLLDRLWPPPVGRPPSASAFAHGAPGSCSLSAG